jgi:hypothetical protein
VGLLFLLLHSRARNIVTDNSPKQTPPAIPKKEESSPPSQPAITPAVKTIAPSEPVRKQETDIKAPSPELPRQNPVEAEPVPISNSPESTEKTPEPLPEDSAAEIKSAPPDPMIAARAGYSLFFDEFLKAIRKSDCNAATALVAHAEEDPVLQPLNQEVHRNRIALDLISEREAALKAGLEKLRDVDSFELQMIRGEPMKIGKRAPYHVDGVKADSIDAASEQVTVSVQLTQLRPETRERIAALGVKNPASALLFQALDRCLSAENFNVSELKTTLDRAHTAGVSEATTAYLLSLAEEIDRVNQNAAAKLAWEGLTAGTASKQKKSALQAIDVFVEKFGKTEFFSSVQNDLQTLKAHYEVDDSALASGLIAHWKLDDGKGDVAADSSSSKMDGAIKGKPEWVKTKNGGALRFDGVSDHIRIPDRIFKSNTDFSMCLWINGPDHQQQAILLGQGDKAKFTIIGIQILGAGRLEVTVNGSVAQPLKSTTKLKPDTWNHLALTYNASRNPRLILYVNGVQDGFAQFGPNFAGDVFTIGAGASEKGRHFFKGMISDVRLYSRSLNEKEIKALAAPQSGP